MARARLLPSALGSAPRSVLELLHASQQIPGGAPVCLRHFFVECLLAGMFERDTTGLQLAGDLPGNFEPARAPGDLEPIATNFRGHVQTRSSLADRGELVLEILVQGSRSLGKPDHRLAFAVEMD